MADTVDLSRANVVGHQATFIARPVQVHDPSTVLSQYSSPGLVPRNYSSVSLDSSMSVPSLASDHPSILSAISEASLATPDNLDLVADGGLAADGNHAAFDIVNGDFLQRAEPLFHCAFWFLKCPFVTHHVGQWKAHSLDHFRHHPPPKFAQCPLCPLFRVRHNNGLISWEARMDHIATHYWDGDTLMSSNPDFQLFDYLWQTEIIEPGDYQELMQNHSLARAPLNRLHVNAPTRRQQDERENYRQRQRRQRPFNE